MLRQSSVAVERFWAAALGVGTVSALSYTQLGTNMLSKIFSTGVATVLLPILSQSICRQGEKQGSENADALRLALFITAPVTAFSTVLSYPVCQIVFMFSDTDSALVTLTSRLLAVYALRVPLLALLSVLLAPFYARGDVGTPVKHMMLMLGVNLALDFLLFRRVAAYGFPIAAVLTDTLSVARAFWLQKRAGIRYHGRSLGRDLATILTSAGVAVLIVLALYSSQIRLIEGGVGSHVLFLGLAVMLGGLVYLVTAHRMGIPEARQVGVMIRTTCARAMKR
jgi:putative peptidoglycan lipid II flippase